MTKLNYKLKIVDNFLNNEDFSLLCNLNISQEFKSDFKVYHNKINNNKIYESTIDKKLLIKLHNNYFNKAFAILKELSPEKSKLYDYSDFTIIITKKK